MSPEERVSQLMAKLSATFDVPWSETIAAAIRAAEADARQEALEEAAFALAGAEYDWIKQFGSHDIPVNEIRWCEARIRTLASQKGADK